MSTELLVQDALLGMIVAFAGTRESLVKQTANTGWLLCEGQLAQRTAHPSNQKLFDVIGFAWGKGPEGDERIFRLPDLRGQFLRGVATDKQQDPDINVRRTPEGTSAQGELVGTKQAFAVHQHSHTFNTTSGGHPHLTDNYAIEVSIGHKENEDTKLKIVNDIGPIVKPFSRVPDEHVSTETRPQNVYVYYLIYAGKGFKCL